MVQKLPERGTDPHMSDEFNEEISKLLNAVNEWAGGEDAAKTWISTFKIPALGNKTAEELIREGQATALWEYLKCMDVGTFQ